jgi:hypothetical protein
LLTKRLSSRPKDQGFPTKEDEYDTRLPVQNSDHSQALTAMQVRIRRQLENSLP